MVGCFVGFYIDVLVLSDFLYVFSEFCLEIICCDAVDFKLYSLDHIEHVVFKFIEGAYMRWWAFRFESVGFFMGGDGVLVP